MKHIVALLMMLFPVILSSQNIEKSIVKIHVVTNEFDYNSPWQKTGTFNYSGSGCVIQGKRILTNAHVIVNSTFVQVQLPGKQKKFIAEVSSVCEICDLAVLEVDDPDFNSFVSPVPFGEIPKSLDDIEVYGFPIGGEEMSITKGVISRTEHDMYSHSYAYLFACQIDAAVNPGNSGGPVLKDGKLVGIVMQGYEDAQNTNYFIPINIIKHYLEDISDGNLDGFPSLLIDIQTMENDDMRAFYKMEANQSGIIVTDIFPDSPVKNILKINDVLLSIDGNNIDNDGKITFRKNERTFYSFFVEEKQIGDQVNVMILRDGKEMSFNISLDRNFEGEQLVPYYKYNETPQYYILGGFVFQPLTLHYIDTYEDIPPNLNYYNYYVNPSEEQKSVVILSKVLSDKVNKGYQEFGGYDIIKNVNGKNITCFSDLISAFDNNDNKYHIITFESKDKIIIDREQVNKRNQIILNNYGIPFDRSENLR